MAPLPFWQLLLGLICVLVAGHVLSWWAWRALAFSGPWVGRGITGMAHRRKALAWLQRRAPATTRFMGARLTVERFSGLPLTLIAGLAVYLVFLGAGLLELVGPAPRVEFVAPQLVRQAVIGEQLEQEGLQRRKPDVWRKLQFAEIEIEWWDNFSFLESRLQEYRRQEIVSFTKVNPWFILVETSGS